MKETFEISENSKSKLKPNLYKLYMYKNTKKPFTKSVLYNDMNDVLACKRTLIFYSDPVWMTLDPK